MGEELLLKLDFGQIADLHWKSIVLLTHDLSDFALRFHWVHLKKEYVLGIDDEDI